MWELVKAGGWLMLPLILSSILRVAITIERYIRLRRSQVLPQDYYFKVQMLDNVISHLEQEDVNKKSVGRILKAGYDHQDPGRAVCACKMEATASQGNQLS